MPDVEHLSPSLKAKVDRLVALSGGKVWIESGFRSYAQQQALWNASDKTGKKVARPGHSNHERGLAVDLGGDLNLAHQLMGQVGLVAPMSWEPWHVEEPGTRAKVSPLAYTPNPAHAQSPTAPAIDKNAQLDHILAHPIDFTGQGYDATFGTGLAGFPAGTQPAGSAGTTGGGGDVQATITRIAQELGVDRKLALAMAHVEDANLDPRAQGDNGTSFGIYQLHRGGELGANSPEWAYNVENNARTALGVVASVARQHPEWSPGQIAAAAQRPADHAGYAAKVDALYGGM